ncbi:hypothetical protein SDC9_58878 [bioreactor metagenome]|uniref:START domain-containing protein n=1 Tax=bioreactor metagenome TaxID=1076179 RepID=A0A644X8M6_9ZZZZ
MKTTNFKLHLITLLVILFSSGIKAMASDGWELIDSESGISMYERWIYVNEDLSVKERKGEFSVPGTINDVVNKISNVSLSKQWMENVTEASMVKRLSESIWYTYTYFSLPWPFANRDLVAVWMLGFSADKRTATIEIRSRETMIPEKDGIKRLGNYKATWVIRDKGSNSIGVSFSAVSFNGPEFPRIVQDPVLRKTFIQNMINLKLLLLK